MKPGKGKTSSSFLRVWGKLSFPSCVFLPSVSLYPHGDHVTSEAPGPQNVVVSPHTRQFSETPSGFPTLETGVWHALPGYGIGFHRLKAQSLKTASIPQTHTHTHFRCQSQDQTVTYASSNLPAVDEFPMTHLLGFHYFLKLNYFWLNWVFALWHVGFNPQTRDQTHIPYIERKFLKH